MASGLGKLIGIGGGIGMGGAVLGGAGAGNYNGAYNPADPYGLNTPYNNTSHDDGSDSSGTGYANACPPSPNNEDPCRGLRKQLMEHIAKLQQYIADPSWGDDGRLAAAAGNPERVQKIIEGRIRSLQEQIDNFRRQLEECEKLHGK